MVTGACSREMMGHKIQWQDFALAENRGHILFMTAHVQPIWKLCWSLVSTHLEKPQSIQQPGCAKRNQCTGVYRELELFCHLDFCFVISDRSAEGAQRKKILPQTFRCSFLPGEPSSLRKISPLATLGRDDKQKCSEWQAGSLGYKTSTRLLPRRRLRCASVFVDTTGAGSIRCAPVVTSKIAPCRGNDIVAV